MAKEISSGINCLHDANIIHRDFSRCTFLGIIKWRAPFKNITDTTEVTYFTHVINDKRETSINGTPVDFMNIYCDAWNDDPNLRPSIVEIHNKLDKIRMVPVYHNKQNINIDVTSYSVSPELNNAENNNNYIQDMGSVEQRLNQLQVVNQDDSSLNSENSFFMSKHERGLNKLLEINSNDAETNDAIAFVE
ncbi:hypothetical protein C2G38_2051278 [Gigaspora rosea]|uniref:Protein kinase domain-containing protein n=1 Tax=Gigaspora rosea TaxID=44941 RepID=A0A397TVK9_9GLOM|nr:hypothetical protein C2G38_2051278 [Gigaspora rosea]